MQKSIFLCLFVLLAACSTQAPALPTNTALLATPTAEPTRVVVQPAPTEPASTSGPAPAVTASSAAATLPAPLLVLERGQISRIETDGVTRSRLTEETVAMEGLLPITEFVIVPGNADLIYIVGDLEVDRLMRADPQGKDARQLYSEPQIELSDLQISPDGTTLALRLLNNREQVGDLPSGVYLLPIDGSSPPRLLLADDPVDDPVNPSRALRKYSPLAFAPDGTRLLLRGDSAFYDGCKAMVLPLSDAASPLELRPDTGIVASCTQPVWSRDSSAVFVFGQPEDLSRGSLGLYRVDASSGAGIVLQPVGSPGDYAFVRAPWSLLDGAIAFFVGRLPEAPPAAGGFQAVPLQLVRAASDAASDPQLMRSDTVLPFSAALWHPDGTGAVLLGQNAEGAQTLTYVPVGDSLPVALPVTGDNLEQFHWGK
jgi:hypothetical protein